MKNGYKEDIVVIIFIISFICAVIFMCTCRNSVYDNRYGIDNVRNELENATNSQREEATAIDETKQSINRSETAITNSEERVDDSTKTNREITSVERKDAEIIDECEQILARVRERTATEDSQS